MPEKTRVMSGAAARARPRAVAFPGSRTRGLHQAPPPSGTEKSCLRSRLHDPFSELIGLIRACQLDVEWRGEIRAQGFVGALPLGRELEQDFGLGISSSVKWG